MSAEKRWTVDKDDGSLTCIIGEYEFVIDAGGLCRANLCGDDEDYAAASKAHDALVALVERDAKVRAIVADPWEQNPIDAIAALFDGSES